MTPERARQITDLLQSALERSGAERTRFLDAACAGDAALRGELDALLAAERHAGEFLEGSAITDAAATLLGDEFVRHEPGSRIGPYLIERRLGGGGMGEVFLSEDVRLGRKVALKLLDPALVDDSVARARFLREARLLSALEHPNICTLYEVGEVQDRLFIAMQYVEGDTLRNVIGGRPLALERLLPIARQVADALAAAHARGIVHRDVKSSNLMVTPQQVVKVLDFGLATLLERDDQVDVTIAGAVIGTPTSMAPEQARGERVGPRGDVFSFGVVLYEMATGAMPFTGRSRAEVVDALLHTPHTPVREVNPSIPLPLARLIDRALSKNPSDRYQTMTELLEDLHAIDTHGEAVASWQPRAQARVPRLSMWILAALLAVAVIVPLLFLATRAPESAAAADPQVRSIAVLPFRPLVAAQRDEVLQFGMADTLITRLSAIRNLAVRPITAVRQYDALEQDAVVAGREQRVDAVIDGRIQQAGERVRITVRLLRVRDGRQLWAEQFDQPRADIFALQDAVSERVSSALVVTLSGDEQSLLTKRHTGNVEAYELYLLGRYHLNRLTDEGFTKALEYFADAVAKDPGYAAAHAGIAEAHFNLSGFNAVRPQEGFPKARAAAERALRLDDSLAEAHAVLAGATFLYDWNWAAAEVEYRRAIQLNPSASDVRMQYGFYLASLGRSQEALRETQRALDLDPRSPVKISGVGDVLHWARRFDAAEAQYRQALEIDPNFGYAHWALGRALTEQRRYAEAESALRRAIALSGDSPDETAELARCYALAGKKAEAMALLEKLRAMLDRRYVAPTTFVWIYAALGDHDRAFAWLERALAERDFLLVMARVEPMFDALRNDPRFAVLLQRLAFPPVSTEATRRGRRRNGSVAYQWPTGAQCNQERPPADGAESGLPAPLSMRW